MIITASKTKSTLTTPAGEFPISFRVRTQENGRLKKVVLTIPNGKPYKPQEFPNGRWELFKPLPRESAYLAPFFIPTDAHATVEVWKVSGTRYIAKTGGFDIDYAYGLHFSSLDFTDGCIRFIEKDDLIKFAQWRERQEGRVFLDVIE